VRQHGGRVDRLDCTADGDSVRRNQRLRNYRPVGTGGHRRIFAARRGAAVLRRPTVSGGFQRLDDLLQPRFRLSGDRLHGWIAHDSQRGLRVHDLDDTSSVGLIDDDVAGK
jgi:hypothetical protein